MLVCAYTCAATSTETNFHISCHQYIISKTNSVRITERSIQPFDKYFVWLLVSSTLPTALSEKLPPSPPKLICFQYCVKGLYHIFLYCMNFEFILNTCLCDLDLLFSLRVLISAFSL